MGGMRTVVPTTKIQQNRNEFIHSDLFKKRIIPFFLEAIYNPHNSRTRLSAQLMEMFLNSVVEADLICLLFFLLT